MSTQYKVGQWVELIEQVQEAAAGTRWQIMEVDVYDPKIPVRIQGLKDIGWLLDSEFKLLEDRTWLNETQATPQSLINHLYNDLLMLQDGRWEPDYDSVEASLDNVKALAAHLKITPEGFRG